MISEMITETTQGVDKAIVIAVSVVLVLVVCGGLHFKKILFNFLAVILCCNFG
jgi:hypothetical protein